jgi:hypothetical protein
MASITTRQTGTTGVDGVTRKNEPLSNTEIDLNFINLNNSLTKVQDDNSSDELQYLTMSRQTSGEFNASYVSSTKLYFNPSTGQLNSTNYNSLSDIQFKENVEPAPSSIVYMLNGVEFTWKETGKKSAGVIAQDVEKVIPHAVSVDKNGVKSVNYNALVGYLIETVKELKQEIETLKGK